MSVIGQCLDNGDGSGTSAIMDVYETLLILVGRSMLSASMRPEHAPRKPRCLAGTSLTLFNSFWNAVGITTMNLTPESPS